MKKYSVIKILFVLGMMLSLSVNAWVDKEESVQGMSTCELTSALAVSLLQAGVSCAAPAAVVGIVGAIETTPGLSFMVKRVIHLVNKWLLEVKNYEDFDKEAQEHTRITFRVDTESFASLRTKNMHFHKVLTSSLMSPFGSFVYDLIMNVGPANQLGEKPACHFEMTKFSYYWTGALAEELFKEADSRCVEAVENVNIVAAEVSSRMSH